MKKQIKFDQLFNYFPVPVVLISSKAGKKENAMAAAWCGIVCSLPATVAVAIRPHRHSSQIIKKSKEFVINVPSENLLEKVDLIGTISGKEEDKFKETGLTTEKGASVATPLIKECTINLECKVKQIIPLGTHDVFIAEVEAIHADEECLKNGEIDFSLLKPLVLLDREYWALREKLSKYGFSREK